MFLFKTDYQATITDQDLNELLYGDPTMNGESIRLKAEVWAQERMSAYIRQRYDVAKIFTSWIDWSYTKAYAIGDYFQYTEPAFDATKSYVLNVRMSYEGNIYSCKVTNVTGAFDATKWQVICEDLNIYTCILASTSNYPEDILYFTQSDPRNVDVVTMMIDIVVYRINNLIVPSNIPEQRLINYNNNGKPKAGDGSAIGILLSIQEGGLTYDLPEYSDDQKGQSVTWGSNMKRNNSY